MFHIIIQTNGKVVSSNLEIKNTTEFFLKEGTKREMYNSISTILKAISNTGFTLTETEIERMSKETILKIMSVDFKGIGIRHKVVSKGIVYMGYIKIYALRK